MTLTKKIRGNSFGLEPLPAMNAFVLQPRIAPAIAAALQGVGGVIGELGISSLDALGDIDMARALAAIAPAVAAIAKVLPPSELRAIVLELLGPWQDSAGKVHEGLTMDGNALFALQVPGAAHAPQLFDSVMQGRTVDTWLLIGWGVQINYPDFFALAARSGGAAKTASDSATSTAPTQ